MKSQQFPLQGAEGVLKFLFLKRILAILNILKK